MIKHFARFNLKSIELDIISFINLLYQRKNLFWLIQIISF